MGSANATSVVCSPLILSVDLKRPLFCFQEERLKVKGENPSYSICEIAKELGRRWAEMAPEIKQRYQQVQPTGLSHL